MMKCSKSLYFMAIILVVGMVFIQTASAFQTYNNTRPGGTQQLTGVDSAEIRPNLLNPGAQLWFHDDGRWDAQGGKFSLLFPSQEAFQAYCANPNPSPAELRRLAEAEPLCPSSVGKGQKWLMFKVNR